LSYTHHDPPGPREGPPGIADHGSGWSGPVRTSLRARRRRAGDLERRGQSPRGVGVRTGLRHEDRGPVELQLLDAFRDVGERAVPTMLLGGVEVDPGVPAAGQLLDRA